MHIIGVDNFDCFENTQSEWMDGWMKEKISRFFGFSVLLRLDDLLLLLIQLIEKVLFLFGI